MGNTRRVLTILSFLAVSLHAQRVLKVGAGEQYATPAQLPALLPGDLVTIGSGTYTNMPKKWFGDGTAAKPITIRGVGPTAPIFDGRGLTLEAPRAFFEFYGTAEPPQTGRGYWVLENVECQYAQNRATTANGACARNVNAQSLTIRDIKAWNGYSGVMSSEGSGTTTIEDSDIGFNGHGQGLSHNLYMMGQRFILRRSRIHDSIVGQNVKTRSRVVEITQNEIFNGRDGEIGIVQAGDGTPAGAALTSNPNSNALVATNVITTLANRNGGNCCMVIAFGRDMGTIGRNGSLFLYGNTITLNNPQHNAVTVFGSANENKPSLDARMNTFVGAGGIISQREALKAIAGYGNWTETGAKLIPNQWTTPAVFDWLDDTGLTLISRPPVARKKPLGIPQNVRNVVGLGGIGVQWDPVPGAAYYKILRQFKTNGKLDPVITTWGGASEPLWVDMFGQPASTATSKREYVYRVIAVDAAGNVSGASNPITVFRPVPPNPQVQTARPK